MLLKITPISTGTYSISTSTGATEEIREDN